MTWVLVGVYMVAMVAANTIVWWLGPWISPVNAFVLIGLDLALRDVLQERLSRLELGAVIVMASAVTWAINPGAATIAIASAVAFLCAALADWATYEAAKARGWPFLRRSNASNVVGAAVDSLIFPTLAFGVLLPGIIALQFAAKVAGGAIWSLALWQLVRARR